MPTEPDFAGLASQVESLTINILRAMGMLRGDPPKGGGAAFRPVTPPTEDKSELAGVVLDVLKSKADEVSTWIEVHKSAAEAQHFRQRIEALEREAYRFILAAKQRTECLPPLELVAAAQTIIHARRLGETIPDGTLNHWANRLLALTVGAADELQHIRNWEKAWRGRTTIEERSSIIHRVTDRPVAIQRLRTLLQSMHDATTRWKKPARYISGPGSIARNVGVTWNDWTEAVGILAECGSNASAKRLSGEITRLLEAWLAVDRLTAEHTSDVEKVALALAEREDSLERSISNTLATIDLSDSDPFTEIKSAPKAESGEILLPPQWCLDLWRAIDEVQSAASGLVVLVQEILEALPRTDEGVSVPRARRGATQGTKQASGKPAHRPQKNDKIKRVIDQLYERGGPQNLGGWPEVLNAYRDELPQTQTADEEMKLQKKLRARWSRRIKKVNPPGRTRT